MSTLTEDESAQLKGICDVVYCPGDLLLAIPSSFSKISKVARRNGKLIEGLPCRISTFHFCYDDPRVKFVITALGSHFGKNVRLRIRTHYGTFGGCISTLAVRLCLSLITSFCSPPYSSHPPCRFCRRNSIFLDDVWRCLSLPV